MKREYDLALFKQALEAIDILSALACLVSRQVLVPTLAQMLLVVFD
jgi:hypothetical protein